MTGARRKLARSAVFAAGLLLSGGFGPVLGQEEASAPQPYELMRDLRQVQDRVARGDAEAVIRQRTLIEKIAADFEKADDEAWKEPRNARAVLAFVLSGGDPKVLRGLLLRGQPSGVDVSLARGVHAFISNRKGEALDHFASVNALGLEPTIAGQVALAQAELAARTDLNKALDRLAEARLLAPGTLLEEAALRRQIVILSGQKEFDRADLASEIYFRRFTHSAYSGAVKRQIARFAPDRPAIDDSAPGKLLETAINRLDKRERLEIYLEIAKEAVGRGRRDVVAFAAERALQFAGEGSAGRIRAQIFLASMQVATLEADKARAALESLKSDDLSKEETELIAAAQSIAGEVHRVGTVTPSDKPDPEWLNELGVSYKNVGLARQLLAAADRLLGEAAK